MTGAKEGGYNPPISASFSQRRTGQSVFGQRISYSNTNRERKRGQKRQGSVFCSWEQWRNPVFQTNFSSKRAKMTFIQGKGKIASFLALDWIHNCVFRICYVLSLVHYGKNKRDFVFSRASFWLQNCFVGGFAILFQELHQFHYHQSSFSRIFPVLGEFSRKNRQNQLFIRHWER